MNSKQNNDIKTKHHFPLLLALALTMGVFAAGSEELVISPLLPDLAKASIQMSVSLRYLSVFTAL